MCTPRTLRRRIALCAAFALYVYAFGIPLAALADLSAVEILERAITAPERTNYRGQQSATIYYTQEPRHLVADIIHRKPFTTKVRLILPAETAGRVILLTENERRHYEPALGQLVITPFPGREIQRGEVGDLGLLCRNYDVRLVGTDKFLGRKTYNISLDPRYPGIAARKLAVDAQTFIWLKSEVYTTGPEQKLRAVTYFASISFPGSVPDSQVSLDVPKGTKVARLIVPRRFPSVRLVRLSFRPVMPVVIPMGFVFKDAGLSVGIGPDSTSRGQTLHLRFTNGDSSISLFESPKGSDGAAAASGAARQREGYNFLSWSDDHLSLVLMGDVDESVLKEFKKWISPSKEREAVAKFSLAFKMDRNELEKYLGSGVELHDVAEIVAAARAAEVSAKELFEKRLGGLSTEEIWAQFRFDQATLRRAMEEAKQAQKEGARILRMVYGHTPPSR